MRLKSFVLLSLLSSLFVFSVHSAPVIDTNEAPQANTQGMKQTASPDCPGGVCQPPEVSDSTLDKDGAPSKSSTTDKKAADG